MSEKAVVRKADLLPAPMTTMIQSLIPDCGKLLPGDITEEQFRAGLWLELTGRPGLHGCVLDSIRQCIVSAATDGMLPGRDTYFLPFRVRGQMRATKVDNYHGLQRALERSGKVVRSWAAPVCEGDTWEFDRFMDRPKHIEAMALGKKPGKELFYYGAILFKDGTCAFEPISLEDLAAIEACSPSHETGPWKEWPQMMRRKSALKRVCKYVPVTPELARILEADDARLQTDMPPGRHLKNVTDLFDNGPGASTPEREMVVDVVTGEVSEAVQDTPKNRREGGKVATTSQGEDIQKSQSDEDAKLGDSQGATDPCWRRTIEHYLLDSDIMRERIPKAFYDQCLAAFHDPTCPDAQGDALAATLLEWVAEYEATP